jgi:hypothetical protein
MANLTCRQRAECIVHDFLEAEFDDRQGEMRWLVERIAIAIEDAETAARNADWLVSLIPPRAFCPGH